MTNLPFIALDAYGREYTTIAKNDVWLMKGYLQNYYKNGNERIFLNDFSDRIKFFKSKSKLNWDNTEIINAYMQFIYSTLEYYIIPIVNIGIDLRDHIPDWGFGTNVLASLDDCKSKYYTKTYGNLNVDDLQEPHKLVISAMKDYGMNSIIKNLNIAILDEIVGQLNVRYSTSDVINAINYLSLHSLENSSFFKELKRKYFI